MYTKMILLGLACLAANMVMVAGDCTPPKGIENFNYKDVDGTWYKRKANAAVFDVYHHYVFNIEIHEETEATATGTVQDFRAGNETKTFNGGWVIPEDHSSTFKPGFSKTLEMFNGTYTIVGIDPKCFFLLQGCPDGAPGKDVVSMFFRDEKPTEECCKESDEALDKAGISRSLVITDPTYQ